MSNGKRQMLKIKVTCGFQRFVSNFICQVAKEVVTHEFNSTYI